MGFVKQKWDKNCIICGKAFVAYHKKGLYCDDRKCKKQAERNRKVVNQKLSLNYAFENHLLMKKLDYIIQAFSLLTGIPTPYHLIPTQNKVDLSHWDKDLVKAFDVEKKRIANRVDKLNKKIAERKPIIPKITDKILKEYEEIESSRKININVEDLRGILKKLFTDTIKKNTGKFPIMTPQEINKIGDIIDKVKNILIKKDDSDISNSDIVDYIKEHTLDINKMIDEKYFN